VDMVDERRSETVHKQHCSLTCSIDNEQQLLLYTYASN